MATALRPLFIIAFAATLILSEYVDASESKSPFSPPSSQEFHHPLQRDSFSANRMSANSDHDSEKTEHKSSHGVIPEAFAADRIRKGKRKSSINSVASKEHFSADLQQHGNFKRPIFCYYGSSANRRPSKGKFEPENIDPFLCSHLIFAFVDISKDGTGLRPNNKDDLGPNGLYARTMKLKEKNPKLKILLAAGGWKIGSKPFLPVIKERSTWKTWIANVVQYLRKYGFDGFDMDWEFPGWRGSGPEDQHKFTLLMKDLHDEFAEESRVTGKPRLILTLATASSVFYIEKSYEPKEIHKHIDYMLLMTYNFHGSGWEKQTGHPSPLLPHPLDPEGEQRELFVLWAIKYWLQQGVPKSKLVMGMPTYGLGWKLTDHSKTGVRAPADGGNTKGKYTAEQGILSHYEICEHVLQDGWKVEWIDEQKVPYAYGQGEWVGFESPDSLYLKAVTVLKEGLGGAFIWSVEMDDFGGYCGGPTYPLLRTVNEVFTQSDKLGFLQAAPSDHHHQQQSAPASISKASSGSHSSEASSSSSHISPESGSSHSRSDSEYYDSHSSHDVSSSWDSGDHYDPYAYDDSSYDYAYYNSESHEEAKEHVPDVDCNHLGVGIHPDPDSCQYFVLCVPTAHSSLGAKRMECPKGTKFDDSLKVCNHDHEVDCS